MKRSLAQYLVVSLKGIAMGAADVVPGVSGGTIAFISGIYEELINSIRSVDHIALKVLLKKGPIAFYKHINGNFLLSLFIGIGIAVLSLVKLIHFLLDNEPILIWSFFFGLILSSALMVARKVKVWTPGVIISTILGAAIAFYVGIATPGETPEDLWFIFLSGMIAICAMILPGISGSFLLLLLRKYEYITGAISELKLDVLAVFGLGAIIGITSFSHLLSWLFKKFHDLTIALLAGFMIGSLNIVWPWKEVIETRVNSKGIEVPFRYESVLPQNFSGESELFMAIVLMLIGIATIISIESLSSNNQELSR